MKTRHKLELAGFLVGAVALVGLFTPGRGCVTSIDNAKTRGNSLTGVIEDGAKVKILNNYYQCHAVARGDIVAYRYAGDSAPLIKIVKGVPGDKFDLQSVADGSVLTINGEIVFNSLGQPYILGKDAGKMISLYIKDYNGVIPPNAYLILGNLANGSLDSTRFGLVDKGDILGKVEQ